MAMAFLFMNLFIRICLSGFLDDVRYFGGYCSAMNGKEIK